MNQFRMVGVLHLPALPGAANYGGQSVAEMAEAAAHDARILASAGFTDVIIQDASDSPQPITVESPTIAALSVIGASVRAASNMTLGVIAGHNDGAASVAIAHAIDAAFIRVKVLTGTSVGPTGFMHGCALQVAHMKRLLGSDVEIWADVHEATSLPLVGDIGAAALQSLAFGNADKLIVTRDSSVKDALDDIARLKEIVGDGIDILVGGRVTADTLNDVLLAANGVISGSALKTGDGPGARVDSVAAHKLGDQFTAFLAAP